MAYRMLSYSQRLSGREVEAVFKQGRFFNGLRCSLKISVLPGCPTTSTSSGQATKFAVVAGVKVARQAVDRNRLRRRLRHALKPLASRCRPGYAVVALAQAPALKAPLPDITRELSQLLTRAGILNSA